MKEYGQVTSTQDIKSQLDSVVTPLETQGVENCFHILPYLSHKSSPGKLARKARGSKKHLT
jgi:hypothetical protein